MAPTQSLEPKGTELGAGCWSRLHLHHHLLNQTSASSNPSSISSQESSKLKPLCLVQGQTSWEAGPCKTWWPCCCAGHGQSPQRGQPAQHGPYHDASEQTDTLPAVGVWDHVAIADGEEGDGDEPHGTQEVAGYVLLVMVPAKGTWASVLGQGMGSTGGSWARRLPQHKAVHWGRGIKNVADALQQQRLHNSWPREKPHGQNQSGNSAEKASASCQSCHHIPVPPPASPVPRGAAERAA